MAEFTTCEGLVAGSPGAVFGFLVDPAQVHRWLVPNETTVELDEADVRVGGRFAVTLHHDRAGVATWSGHVSQLVPEERIVVVLRVETDDPDRTGDMTVWTSLAPDGGGTHLGIEYVDGPPGIDRHAAEVVIREVFARIRSCFDARATP